MSQVCILHAVYIPSERSCHNLCRFIALVSIVNINMCPNFLSNRQLHLKIKNIDITHHFFYADFCENNVVPTYTPCHIQHLLLDDTNDTFVNSDLSFACIISSHQSIHQSTLIIPYTQLSSNINIQWINQ